MTTPTPTDERMGALQSPHERHRALVRTTMAALGESPERKSAPWWHFTILLQHLAPGVIEELVAAAVRGPDGAREGPIWAKKDGAARTTGGAFFAMVRGRLSKTKWDRAHWWARECFKRSQGKGS